MSSDQEQDVEMGEQKVEQPKRGRGRPKKVATKSKAEEKSSDEPIVKRGRGRPPTGASKAKAEKATKAKNTGSEEDADAGNGEVEEAGKAPPKRRGRKRAPKEKEPEESEEDAESVEEDSAPVPAPPTKTKGAKGGKKATKNGHANGEEKDDEAAEEEKSDKSEGASSDSRIKIVVEHCKSCHTYRKKAEDIITALKEKWSNIDVEYKPKPRKGSFEINLINNGNDVKLWTGLELGPPRKLKFPDVEKVVEAMEKAYVPESA